MTAARPTVLVVGAASRDVVDDDPRGWRLGGAVTFCSLALARLGLEVRALVGADPEAAAARELELLRAAGVAVQVAPLASGPVFDNVAHLLHAEADPVTPSALPAGWADRLDGLLLVPVAAEVRAEWADVAAVARRPVVGVGWQGLLRVLRAGEAIRPTPPRTSPLLRAADLVTLSVEDVAPGTAPESLLVHLGPSTTLACTAGPAGGLVLEADADGTRRPARAYPAIPADRVVDPTGAGDVFLAAMLAAALQPSLGEPTTVAAAASSLTVEGPGLEGVPDLAAVRRRMTRAPSRASLRPSDVSSRESGRPSQA